MKQHKLLIGVFGVSLAIASASTAYGEDGKGEDKKHGERIQVGQGVSQALKLSNSGIKAEELEINFSGKDAGEFRQTNDCGEKLAGKASCTITVTFAPKTRGDKSATMEIHTSGGTQSVPLSGTGV